MYVARKRVGGKEYLYFRWRGVYRRLPDDMRSDEFRVEYARALASLSPEHEKPIISGSVRALIRDFKAAPEWKALAPKTQAGYAKMLDYLRPIGDFQATNVRRAHIVGLRNKIGSGTRTLDFFVSAVSRMFSIGIDLGYTDRNPAARIARLNDAEGFTPWSAVERRQFEQSEMPEWLRTAYMLGLWTGQRESDVLRLAWAKYDGKALIVRQGRPEAKRGKGRKGPIVQLYIPASGPLRAYLSALPKYGPLMVARGDGTALTADALRKAMRAHLDGIGLPDLHFHGLRHTTATALAEAGASTVEIQSITGHQTEQMVKRYTRRAEQKRLAGNAIAKLEYEIGDAVEEQTAHDGKSPDPSGKDPNSER